MIMGLKMTRFEKTIAVDFGSFHQKQVDYRISSAGDVGGLSSENLSSANLGLIGVLFVCIHASCKH